MRGISIKSLIIANAAYLIIAIITGAVIAFLAALTGWLVTDTSTDANAMTGALRSSELVSSLIFAAAIAPTAVGVGYLAGRIADRSYPLNGMLSSSAWAAVRLVDIILGSSTDAGGSIIALPESVSDVLICGSPLLGAVGGWIAGRRHAPGQS